MLVGGWEINRVKKSNFHSLRDLRDLMFKTHGPKRVKSSQEAKYDGEEWRVATLDPEDFPLSADDRHN